MNDALGVLETFPGVEVVDYQDPMRLEEAIPLMVMHSPRRRMIWLAIDFQDAPLAFMAHQEIALQILPAFGAGEPSHAIGQEQYARLVERGSYARFAVRAEIQVVPGCFDLAGIGD